MPHFIEREDCVKEQNAEPAGNITRRDYTDRKNLPESSLLRTPSSPYQMKC